ncbi:MAG: hypothetical protein WC876_04550 [Candidatus Thermoplasmatota archaeon]|jgi:hypothetical protein
MNVTEAFLMVSILLNSVFILGLPIVLFARFLLRRTRWRIIGQGANGVDFREGRPKNGFFLWAAGGGKNALVTIDGALTGTSTDGRPVLWVDTDSATQIAPQRLVDLGAVPDKYKAATIELAVLPSFKGQAVNDGEQTVLKGADGKTEKKLSYLVWQRISGWRLFKTYRDIRVAQLNDPETGMWGVIERMGPLLGFIAVILLIVIIVMLGRLG